MKITHKILLLAFGFGVLGWLLDSFIAMGQFYHEPFLRVVFHPPIHEISMRLMLMAAVIGFGLVTARVINERERARKETESLAKFPLENANPVLRIDCFGTLLFANDASAVMLQEWNAKVGDPVPEFWRNWVCETISASKDGSVDAVFAGRTFNFIIVPIPLSGYANLYGSDITERRAAEEALRKAHDVLEVKVDERTAELRAANRLLQEAEDRTKATNALLQLFVEKATRKDYLDSAVRLLADWSGCRNVGVRVLNNEGFIPYEATVGFSPEFLEKENWLSIHRDHCACIRVILGRAEPQELSAMTPAGSFGSNDSILFLEGLANPEKTRYRGACMAEGYASLAVVPVKYQDKPLGAIHLADAQPGKLTPQIMAFVESISSLIGEAIHRFNVEEDLRQASQALLERSKMLEAFFRHSVTPLVFLDRDFNFIRVNDAYAQACQRDLTDFVGHNHFADYPSEELQVEFERVVATKRPYHAIARPFRFPDHPEWGVSYWTLTLFPVLDGAGEIDFLVFSLEDVTAHQQDEEELRRHRDHLEELIAERSAELLNLNRQLQAEVSERKLAEDKLKEAVSELSRSNEELEQFAYVASHDLQEPLRMVASYVTMLGKRYRGKLDTDADEFIGFAVGGATRMQQLITDLLDFSRVGTRGKPFQPFSMQSALDKALINLRVTVQETNAEITSEPLPVVNGDERQFIQLFQNLIENAIKFRNAEDPRIHVGVERENNTWRFTVTDNGIGIDPKQKDRIFLIFQRLHTAKEYPGTGIGLAICKKIVERHGGRIWIEAALPKGTTFNFTVA